MPGDRRVRISLGTKLLGSVVLLVGLAIAFLNTSAILLMREDREAYTFETKSAESLLAGREFAGMLRNVLAGMRAGLAAVDPRKPLDSKAESALRVILDHYPDIVLFSLVLVDEASGTSTAVHESRSAAVSGASFSISADAMKAVLPGLLRDGYSVVGLSRPPESFQVGVLTADTGLRSPTGLPVSIAVVELGSMAAGLRDLDLTIATDSGQVLFDSDPARIFGGWDIREDALFKFARESRPASATLSFERDGNRYLGSYHRPGLGLVAMTSEAWRDAMRATYALTERLILLGVMSVAAAVIFAIFFASSLISPINRLYEATRVVAEGRFGLNLEIRTHDEIGALTDSFNAMSAKISELFKESVEKVKLENQIDIAATVQRTLIPAGSVDEKMFSIRAHYQSADQCGGDWWGYFTFRNRLFIGIGDVTGHGLPSALITTTAHSCFSFLREAVERTPGFDLSPANALSFAHRAVYDASKGQIQMTFFLAMIDLETGETTFASAGHNPPWVIRADGSFVSLVNPGKRLGEACETPAFTEERIRLEPGDLLYLYTDGMIEAQSPDGLQMSRKAMRSAIVNGPSDPLELVVDRLVRLFLDHTAGHPLQDDVTLVVMKFQPSGHGESIDGPA